MKWPTVKLGEVCNIIAGGTPKRSVQSYWGGSIPWVKISDMRAGEIVSTDECISEEGLNNSAAKLLPAGTVLISIFATIGRTACLKIQATTNQAIVGVIPKDHTSFDLHFLEYCLAHKADELKRKARGVAQDNINGSVLKATEIPLPPLSEQKRIAGILDAADALRAKRREALAQLDTLLQSTFLDLFGDPVTNPKGWEVKRLGDIAILENGDRSSKYPSGPEILEEGILFLSTKNIKNSQLILDTCQFISQQKFESLSRGKLQRYDLVITLRGTLGSCAVFDCNHNTGFINAQILILRSKETIHHVYLHSLIISAPMCDHFAQLATGAAVKQLTGKQIGNLPIPLPPLPLQQRFAAIVEQVEAQKTLMRAQLTELDTLFAALQQRAFNGEL